MAAVAMCPAPVMVFPGASTSDVNERFYKFGTPSPPEQPSPVMYSDLEDSGFHSDEEIQKVSSYNKCLFVDHFTTATVIITAPI